MGRYTHKLVLFIALVVVKSQGVRYNSCNNNLADDIFTMNWLNIHPTPIQVPGELSVSGSFTINQPITGSLELDVTISRSFGPMWIDLPCVSTSWGQLGSCTYRDVCALLARVNGSCPGLFRNNSIPCTCPMPAGTYTIPQTSISLRPNILGFNLPTVAGEYQVSLRLTDKTTMKLLACYDVDVTIADPPSSKPIRGFGRFLANLFG